MSSKNNTKAAKQDRARAAVNELKAYDRSFVHLQKMAELMIAPGEHAPKVFPQRFPGRLGAATFPLVISHQSTAANPTPELTIIVSPDIKEPLRISRPTSVAFSAEPIGGRFVQSLGNAAAFFYTDPQSTQSSMIGGRVALPLRCDNIGGTTNVLFGQVASSAMWTISTYGWNGAAWVLLSTSGVVGLGTTDRNIVTSYTSTYTHISFEAVVTAGGNPHMPISLSFRLMPQVGNYSPSSAVYSEFVMDTYYPAWANLLSNSKYARVVAADLLVKYEGSSLENAGSIAVANIDDEFIVPNESTYDMVASRPFDKYVGRLAPAGEDPGGCHWHYVPMSEFHLGNDGVETSERLALGVVGISGLQEDQVIRVVCHFTLNFYSESPEYKMVIPPPITGFSPILWYLRTQVPLVSSNDLHSIVKSLKKGGAKALGFATDPAVISALSMLAAAL